jgi:peptide/nickel transport system permease protein
MVASSPRRPLQPLLNGWGNLTRFIASLSKTRAGWLGLIGLIFYALLTTIGPLIVPFDDDVKLDQITAPPGSRLQLVTREADVNTYKTLNDLTGKTVGIIDKTGGEKLVAPYADMFTVEETRWRSGRGVVEGLEQLQRGDTDALVLFSEQVKKYITEPSDDTFSNLAVSNAALGPRYWLGADTQGRDIFSHIINGGGILIITALLAGFISTAIAVFFGALAALLGGVVDRVLTAIANFILVIPRFPLLVVLAALFSLSNFVLLATLIGVLSWPPLMRAVRAQVLSLRERDYVEAATALDLGTFHIISREILPNMISFVMVSLVLSIIGAMYQQVGLIFLGMAPINEYSWGVMLYFGRTRGTLFNADSALMVLAPVVAIALFQVSMVMFANALEEVFNPRLRGA